MEETLAASRSSRSRTPQRPPSPPPVVATCGIIVVEDEPKPTTAKTSRRYSFDFRRAVGEGNSKGKGTVTGVVRTDERNPNTAVGNSRNTSGNLPSPGESAGEGSSTVHAAAGRFDGNVRYRLYFKGLVNEENGKGKMTDVLAGFGVAICDLRDNLLFEMKGPLIGHGVSRQGAELKALIRGLTEALKLGIKRIVFCCDSYPIFQFARGKYVAKQKKISLLLNDLQGIMQQFSSSQPVLVDGNDVKFAYKLARESMLSKVTPREDPRQAKAARKEKCAICFNDIYAERMFSVDKCRHRFCFRCVKQDVEVNLLQGMVPKCPHDGCKTELGIDTCGKLLTPELSKMWQQRLIENAIPVTERVYCPYPWCLALMSKTKISETAKSLLSLYPKSGVRRCVECRGLFCVDCKVPWHANMSCTEYKKLHPNPPADEDDDEDEDDYDYNDFLLHFAHAMNDPKPEEPFDPFFDLPDGVIFTPDMLSPKSRRQLYQSDDDDSDEDEFGEYYTRKNLEALCANADEDDEYFGKYGKYTIMYDSDGYELEDFTNPFHPDYPHF
ncbi:PREDICTED: uncharacterized protein LOC104737650 [Camelina sativa]|uniref:RBR-type E3 ubiquitin transferase n=1 Tax=Camelina sativa TaxID=90675 RepID=A0ABM0VHE3_CAMSA|nr:PREDICTED: uncharacterized protein LOC104737650 [Camelina sativa]